MHHEAGLRKLLDSEGWEQARQDAWLADLKADFTTATLSDAERAMLDYALKLTAAPAEITAADAGRLRPAGFDDRGKVKLSMRQVDQETGEDLTPTKKDD